MGFKNGKIINHEGFEPMELNEVNVQAICNRCSKTKEDGSTEWNEEALKKNRANIRYLMGQLALVHEVHEFIEDHEIDRAFAKGYGGKLWAVNDELPIDLFLMGRQSKFCFILKGHRVVLMLNKLKPTLSPQDPKFASWWESADGLVIRAKAAEDEDKPDEALFLYEKVAKMGDADAQYKCGGMYYNDETKPLAKALYWYEKAAEQGHAKAQFQCGCMYGDGVGTARNRDKAKKWFQKAAAQTDDIFTQGEAKKVLREYF